MRKYYFITHLVFSVFFCTVAVFQIHPSEKQLSYLCSDTYKDIRTNQIYSYLFQKDFSVLTRVNHYLHNEIGNVSYIDFKKLKKHFRDASYSQFDTLGDFIVTKKTIHFCCLPKPYLSSLKKEICYFIETKIIPTTWSYNKSCFLHKIFSPHTSKNVYVNGIDYLAGHNYIELIASNGTYSDEPIISLDNEAGRLEYIRFLHGDQEEQLSYWPINYARKTCAMILYIIDDINQSLDSLDHYINDTKSDAPLFIILSSNLQNNEQIKQKLHNKIGKKIVYKSKNQKIWNNELKKYTYPLVYSCDSCKKESGVTLLYPDLFSDFSLPSEAAVKEDLKTKPVCHTTEEPIHLKTEKEKSKKNDAPIITENQSIEPTDADTSNHQKITHMLFGFLKNNSKIIALSSLCMSSIVFMLLVSFKYPRIFSFC